MVCLGTLPHGNLGLIPFETFLAKNGVVSAAAKGPPEAYRELGTFLTGLSFGMTSSGSRQLV